MSTVEIDGAQYSLDDPCSIALALRQIRLTIVTNNSARTIRFGQDETSFHQANLAALDQEIRRFSQQCEDASGTRRRVRYAKSMRYT